MFYVDIRRKVEIFLIFFFKLFREIYHSCKSIGNSIFTDFFKFFSLRVKIFALFNHFRKLPRNFFLLFVVVNFFRRVHHLHKIACKFTLLVVLIVCFGDSNHSLQIFCKFSLFVFVRHAVTSFTAKNLEIRFKNPKIFL